jgi:hypothetical protein
MDITMVIKCRMKWPEHVARIVETKHAYNFWILKSQCKTPLEKGCRRWMYNNKPHIAEKV